MLSRKRNKNKCVTASSMLLDNEKKQNENSNLFLLPSRVTGYYLL